MSSDPNRNRSRKGGKRKIGRSSRKPAHNRYNTERRWEKNKERKARKHQKMLDKKAARKAAKIG
jgi:hypothetical protein